MCFHNDCNVHLYNNVKKSVNLVIVFILMSFVFCEKKKIKNCTNNPLRLLTIVAVLGGMFV